MSKMLFDKQKMLIDMNKMLYDKQKMLYEISKMLYDMQKMAAYTKMRFTKFYKSFTFSDDFLVKMSFYKELV